MFICHIDSCCLKVLPFLCSWLLILLSSLLLNFYFFYQLTIFSWLMSCNFLPSYFRDLGCTVSGFNSLPLLFHFVCSIKSLQHCFLLPSFMLLLQCVSITHTTNPEIHCHRFHLSSRCTAKDLNIILHISLHTQRCQVRFFA